MEQEAKRAQCDTESARAEATKFKDKNMKLVLDLAEKDQALEKLASS